MRRIGFAVMVASMVVSMVVGCGGGSSGSDPGGVAACGASNETCCVTAPICDGGLTCQSGTCRPPPVACGASGEACCASMTPCDAGLTCAAGSCAVPPSPCTDPYAEAPSSAVNAYPEAIVAANVDTDSDLDIVVCGGGEGLYVLRNDGTGQFTASAKFTITARRAVIADFNEDLKNDVVVSSGTDSAMFMPGPGPATTGWRALTTGAGSFGLAAGDLNRDGHLDLVTANQTADTISVLNGVGDGTFAAKVDYATESLALNSMPTAVAVGDLNGDTWPDVAVASQGSSNVTVFLNSGTGTLGAPASVAGGAFGALDIAIADFNGDGHPDLVVPRPEDAYVNVMLGVGEGTFAAPVGVRAAQGNVAIEVADLDDTGGLDVVAVSTESASVALFHGAGDGTFAASVNYAVAREPSDVAIGDFDGDGDRDVAVASYRKRFVQLLENDGAGRLAANVYAPAGAAPADVASGHFDANAFPDLVATNSGANTVSVLLGHGDGRFDPPAALTTGTGPTDVAVGDVNGDGEANLVTANYDAGTVSMLRGVGDGTFQPKQDTDSGGAPGWVETGDFDGDLDDDVIVSSYTDGTTYFLRSNGDGTFEAKVAVTAAYGEVRAADVDANGTLDLVLFAGSYVNFLLGNGDGTFGAPIQKWQTYDFAIGDATADTGLELVVLDIYSNQVGTWVRTTGTAYSTIASRSKPANLRSIALPDVNGDGRADIAMVGDWLYVAINAGDGTDLVVPSYASGYLPGDAKAVDLDGDGRDDLVFPTGDDGLRVLMSVCQ